MVISGGSRISPRWGRQHTILPNFPKNCMKLKEFGPKGARPSRPLRSATGNESSTKHFAKIKASGETNLGHQNLEVRGPLRSTPHVSAIENEQIIQKLTSFPGFFWKFLVSLFFFLYIFVFPCVFMIHNNLEDRCTIFGPPHSGPAISCPLPTMLQNCCEIS